MDTFTLTTDNPSTRDYIITFSGHYAVSSANKTASFRILVDGVAQAASVRALAVPSANSKTIVNIIQFVESVADNKVVKMQWKVSGGTITSYEGSFGIEG